MLSQDEYQDLRRRVLRGQPLTTDEATAVYAYMRGDAAGAAGAQAEKARAPRSKKPSMSDEALDATLDAALKL